MTIIYRRILYITLILTFFVVTPIVSFYAAGYNFNFSDGKVQRTGILILETEPKGAAINLGDQKKFSWLYNLVYQDRDLTTPEKLRNLLPGEYEIKLIKDGYFGYERKIKLEPGQTFVMDEILLFKKRLPEALVNKNIIKTKLSPDKEKLAAVSAAEIYIINLNNNQVEEIPLAAEYSTDELEIIWAPSSKKILLTYGNYPVYNVENKKLESNIENFLTARAENIKWDAFSDNKIFWQASDEIFELNLASEKRTLSIKSAAEIEDYYAENNNLYLMEKSKNGTFLNIYTDNKFLKGISVPPALQYTAARKEGDFIYLQDKKHGIMYLINPWSFLPIHDSLNNLAQFEVINNKILYWNDFEIWSYDINDKNKTLIARISEKINAVVWHPRDSHVIYATDSGFNIIELLDGNFLKTTEILDWRDTAGAIINPDGKSIFFTGWLDSKRALYRLEIN